MRLTTEEFIKRARAVHGNKYDYSKVNYVNCSTKVCIICPEHGEFWQRPGGHLQRCGCPKCGGRYKRSTKDFIKEANKVHNNKYNYLKVNDYKNNRSKVCIICPIHGEFWQTPKIHLKGHGCPKCSGNQSSFISFLNEAKKIHGNKYCYKKETYIDTRNKICIVCPEHGEFLQTAGNHLMGSGCPECSKASKLLKNKENFIQKATKLYNNKYDYSKIEYKNSSVEIEIVCPKHGSFFQNAKQPSI